jgi:hypothetical protein
MAISNRRLINHMAISNRRLIAKHNIVLEYTNKMDLDTYMDGSKK